MQSTIPSNKSALTFCKIDNRADNSDLIKYVAQVLGETNSHKATIMTNEFWKWQHLLLPGGEACVYKSMYENKIAGYYHVPVYPSLINGEAAKFAMIQDVAVNSEIRGQGVFRQLATFANTDLDIMDFDAIYTFPNTKSKHTFIKYNGFTHLHTFTAYMLPVNIGLIAKAKTKIPFLFETLFAPINWMLGPRKKSDYSFTEINKFDIDVVKLYNEYCGAYKFYAHRTAEYLNWRFLQRPSSKYFCFAAKTNNALKAIAFFKIDVMMDVPVLLLIDYAHNDERAFSQLVNYVSTNALKLCGSKIAFTFTSVCDKNFDTQKPQGFIKVPEKVNPRLLNLLIRPLKYKQQDIFDANNWFVTLADWDVF